MNISNTLKQLRENYELINKKSGNDARIAANTRKLKRIIPDEIEIYKKGNIEIWLCDPSDKIPTIIKIETNKKNKILNLENNNLFS
jgi:hypothetical protein